jgi:alpha-ketoglutarate-dependent taurine dioxygenase
MTTSVAQGQLPARGAGEPPGTGRDMGARSALGPDDTEGPAGAVESRPFDAGHLPILIQPRHAGASLSRCFDAIRFEVDRHLLTSGGLLFRGFDVGGVEAFRAFAAELGHPLLGYEFGSTPRSRISEGVYTSTEYPAHQHIPLHNEQSYSRRWPMKIWFYCALAAEHGGETPIADSREVYRRIAKAARERFVERGLMYVRNYGGGLDVAWQDVFNTESPAEVEAYCRANGIDCEWKEDGELRTRQIAQVAAQHPITGADCWFNQAHLFHVSALEPEVREALLEVVGPEDLPRNVYHADGSEIEPGLLEDVRSALAASMISFPWQSGDVLMLDNMLAAHARSPFRGRRQVVVAMAEPHAEPPRLRDLKGR